MVKQIGSWRSYLNEGIWKLDLEELPLFRKYWVMLLRVLMLALKGFNNDQGTLHASALTFYSVLSVVPGLAIAFGIAQVFGFQKTLERELERNFQAQTEVLEYLFSFTRSLLENTQGGLIAGIGFVVVLFTSLRLLSNIEISFNAIWGIKQQRPLIRKLTDFLTIIFIAPVLVVVSGSATVFVQGQVIKIVESLGFLGFASSLIYSLFKLAPYVIIWLLLTLLYMIMPNTRVYLKSAVIAGIIAGTMYEVTQILYIKFQFAMSSYNAIYGSFAALPLFLIWLQLSWTIILVGAEISFAIQNVGRYDYLNETKKLSPSLFKRLAVYIIKEIVQDFEKDTPPISSSQIADNLKLPGNLVVRTLNELEHASLIRKVDKEDSEEYGYVPAIDPDHLTISFIYHHLERSGNNENLLESKELDQIEKALNNLKQMMERSEYNLILKNVK
jgi:membrane protein